MTKVCSKCNIELALDKFLDKVGGKFNKDSICKSCKRDLATEFKRTKRGLLLKIYSTQKRSSVERKIVQPLYSKEDFVNEFINDIKFINLYNSWVENNYNRWSTPSFDRIDDYKPYSFNNIELKTWKENSDKAAADRRYGTSTSGARNIAVTKLTLDGEVICKYISIGQAARECGLNSGNILKAVRGKQQTTGGYRWVETLAGI